MVNQPELNTDDVCVFGEKLIVLREWKNPGKQKIGCVTQSAKISLIAKIPKRSMISILSKMDYGKLNNKNRLRSRSGVPSGAAVFILFWGMGASSIIFVIYTTPALHIQNSDEALVFSDYYSYLYFQKKLQRW